MTHKRAVTTALKFLAIPGLGFAAFGVAHSVSDTPEPQIVLPANTVQPSTSIPARHGAPDDHGIDGPTPATVPGHDAGDDHGVDAPIAATVPRSLPAEDRTHNTRSGHGPTRPTTPGTVDDHGAATTSTAAVTTPAAPVQPVIPTSIDVHAGGSGGGSDDPDGHH